MTRSRRRSGTPAGVLAVMAMVACCALMPLLVSAGLLTGLGAVARSPLLIAAGLLAAALAGYGWQRHRCGTRQPGERLSGREDS